jgi:hypothetical protein
MISDLSTISGTGNLPAVPHGTDLRVAIGETGALQPVRDVAKYLAERAPRPETAGEEGLLITLPAKLQQEVEALVRACKFVADLVTDKWSVQAACKYVIAGKAYARWNWNLNTFRQKFDLWFQKRDWVVLVNFSKAPASWRSLTSTNMPEEFLAYCESKLGKFAREDGKRQALLSIQKHWRVGRDEQGNECAVPGYEAKWSKRDRENLPAGWSYSNIMRQMKKRARATKAVLKMLHISESAARELLPQMLGSRGKLRFLEKITFDDVRMDWLVFNPASGQAEELWLLVARDEATAMVLGFVMHPRTIREDGTASSLGARHMKELAAYILERYPLPPYPEHWIVERGTATLKEAVQAALGELLNNRIKVHYTSMIGDRSAVGYKEKAKGNSRGKASHEAHNRLFHTQLSFVEGQTGADWSIRPADLEARVKECQAIHEFSKTLPESKRGEVRWPLRTLAQARVIIEQICHDQNCRDKHDLEGFDQVIERWTGEKWEVVESAPVGAECRVRKERPYERAMKLIRSVEKWDRISPQIIVSFLEHTQRFEAVEENGEIHFTHEGAILKFRHSGDPLPPGTKCLVYHHPATPEFIHLTTGDGRILGTWVQRGRGNFLDAQALAEGMRYTHAAREAAKATAAELAAPQRASLEEMRAHNERLKDFVTITDAPDAEGYLTGSAVSAALGTVKPTAQHNQQNPPPLESEPDCTNDILSSEDV